MTNRRTGQSIALAAILVQAPRLVLTLLAADHQTVDPAWQRALLVVAGIGTALVLTGGNLYLAHSLATSRRWRGPLAAVWLTILGSSGALLVPMVAAGLSARTLPLVLGSAGLQWGWAVVAAVAHEVTAAGCVLAGAASAAGSQEGSALSQQEQRHELAASELAAAEATAQPLAQLLSCREGCGRTFHSSLAEIGHLRHCPTRLDRQARASAAGLPHNDPSSDDNPKEEVAQ